MAPIAKTRVALTVAGSDSGGGAGIQADMKTFHQFGVHGTSVVTATTAQNTKGVFDVHVVPEAHVAAQLEALAEDLPPDALKSGMLATAAAVHVLAEALERFGWSPYVLDPVMVATSGDRLLTGDAEAAIREHLIPLCTLVTPNAPEASVLTGIEVRTLDDLREAGSALIEMGAGAALMKGGHIATPGDLEIVDVLVSRDRILEIRHERIASTNTHGTGCTLAAAVTAGLASGRDLESAVHEAIGFVERAIRHAPGLGGGHGPLNHGAAPPTWVGTQSQSPASSNPSND
jgi:hydroxymethylpyrimidine/phosphomethylpyrimidine kinase